MSSPDTRALTITHKYVKVWGWIGLVFFIVCSVGAWNAGARGPTLVFLAFVALAVFLLLNSGSMQVDSDSIRYYLPFRSYQIKWNEVQYIEIDGQGGNMVFVGENKKLAVNGPKLWSGKDKPDTMRLIGIQVDKYGIPIRTTEKAMFRLSKNTKVRS